MNGRVKLVMCVLFALSGCSKLTLENYNKISVGMEYDAVVELIGPPEKCDDVLGVRSCQWGDEARSVQVNFVAGQALIFSSRNIR